MFWIDLMVEAKQITGTHVHYPARRASLLATLQALEIKSAGDPAWKESMRQLILMKDTWTDAEWAEIVRYLWTDIEVLPELWRDIVNIHRQCRDAVEPVAEHLTTFAIYRADALNAIARLEHRSRGFPIDVPWLERIYANAAAVRRVIAEDCNRRFGGYQIYKPVKGKDAFSFNYRNLEDYIASLPWAVDWPRTPSGRLRQDANFLDEFCHKNGHFDPLRKTKNVLDQLRSGDLRQHLRDGFIKGSSLPYHTVTSRSQPLASSGFIFSLAHWLRSVVRPHPHHVMLGADWAQQEICIGASLSGDEGLAAALRTGDVYLALAKMAGSVPADATKASHPLERQAFKSIQLGIGYGMGVLSLGRRLYLDWLSKGLEVTLDEATQRAADILRWHKQTFRDYWTFIEDTVSLARTRGWIRARDGWTYFATMNSSFTKLQNFPMQANGAVMLREALRNLAAIDDIELVCSLHDAIYLYAHEDDAIVHENHLRRAMTDAAKRVLAHAPIKIGTGPNEIDLRVDVKVFTHESGYVDPDGAALADRIRQILDDLEH
jgi:hypothetical protein